MTNSRSPTSIARQTLLRNALSIASIVSLICLAKSLSESEEIGGSVGADSGAVKEVSGMVAFL